MMVRFMMGFSEMGFSAKVSITTVRKINLYLALSNPQNLDYSIKDKTIPTSYFG